MVQASILLVEDDEIDYKTVQRTFRDLKIANPLHRAHDGIEALEKLRGTPEHPALPKPVIILLDLNMPRMSGLEFLTELRQDEALKRSIVFVMTTSSAEEDVAMAYSHNVAGYILKHNPAETFISAMCMLEHYWRVVELPEN
jgi:CheY-like chemotaxis protein